MTTPGFTLTPAARSCVVEKNKILLVNNGHCWHLPGGHQEPDESLACCAKRETYEETGYTITLEDIIYIYEFYDNQWSNHKIEIVFRAHIHSSPKTNSWHDLGADQSIRKQQWFSLPELQNHSNIYPVFLKKGTWLNDCHAPIYQNT